MAARLMLVAAVTVAAGVLSIRSAHANDDPLGVKEIVEEVREFVETQRPNDICIWMDENKTEPDDALVCPPTGSEVERLVFDLTNVPLGDLLP